MFYYNNNNNGQISPRNKQPLLPKTQQWLKYGLLFVSLIFVSLFAIDLEEGKTITRVCLEGVLLILNISSFASLEGGRARGDGNSIARGKMRGGEALEPPPVLLNSLSASTLQSHIEYLSHDLLEGRKTGTLFSSGIDKSSLCVRDKHIIRYSERDWLLIIIIGSIIEIY